MSTLHAPRLFLLPWLRPNSHLKALRASCCRRLASVSGLSLGCTLRLAAAAAGASLAARRSDALPPEPPLFLSFLGESPLLECQVSVLERRLFWKLAPVGEVLERDLSTPEALTAGRGARAVEMGMVEVGVDLPDEDA